MIRFMFWFEFKKIFNPFIRIWRYIFSKCVVCGRFSMKYRYCSIECACYDGTFSVKNEKINKPSLFFGHVSNYRKHWKSENHCFTLNNK